MAEETRVAIDRGESYRGEDGGHRFRVIARNERNLAWGESYRNRADAVETLRALVDPLVFVLACETCGRYFGVAWDFDTAEATTRGEPCVCGTSELRIHAVSRGTPILEGRPDRGQ